MFQIFFLSKQGWWKSAIASQERNDNNNNKREDNKTIPIHGFEDNQEARCACRHLNAGAVRHTEGSLHGECDRPARFISWEDRAIAARDGKQSFKLEAAESSCCTPHTQTHDQHIRKWSSWTSEHVKKQKQIIKVENPLDHVLGAPRWPHPQRTEEYKTYQRSDGLVG